ncbi:hypothetical protein [Pasteuria penetrans]|uniref:hypothetical protein n=1 Tax=Pasteuria penetrans TaxID=86005 RepID=UPI0011EDCC86|nr:hypothetical protein [Pasteuria penetrans]
MSILSYDIDRQGDLVGGIAKLPLTGEEGKFVAVADITQEGSRTETYFFHGDGSMQYVDDDGRGVPTGKTGDGEDVVRRKRDCYSVCGRTVSLVCGSSVAGTSRFLKKIKSARRCVKLCLRIGGPTLPSVVCSATCFLIATVSCMWSEDQICDSVC